jgi:hypothetical protein
MIFAANGIPERIDYSMADNPLGPWEYKGIILDENREDGKGTGSFTNHSGIVDYKGHSYIFYHTGQLYDGGGYHRSVAIEEIEYNDDGTINTVPMTDNGVDPVDTLNPYTRVEAETFEYSNSTKAKATDRLGTYGVEKEPIDKVDKGIRVTNIENGDYLALRDVDFTEYGAIKFNATVSSELAKGKKAGTISVYFDDIDSDPVAECDVKGTDGAWEEVSVDVDKKTAVGKHNMYIVFTGEGDDKLFDFDFWSFTQSEVPATPTPTVTSTPVVTNAPQVTATAAPAAETAAPAAASPSAVPSTAEVKAPAKVKVTLKTGKGKITVKINKVKGAVGYRVSYSTAKSFKKGVKSVITKKLSVVLKKLKNRKIYYVKAQGYVLDASGKKVFGKYGKAVKVKVK